MADSDSMDFSDRGFKKMVGDDPVSYVFLYQYGVWAFRDSPQYQNRHGDFDAGDVIFFEVTTPENGPEANALIGYGIVHSVGSKNVPWFPDETAAGHNEYPLTVTFRDTYWLGAVDQIDDNPFYDKSETQRAKEGELVTSEMITRGRIENETGYHIPQMMLESVNQHQQDIIDLIHETAEITHKQHVKTDPAEPTEPLDSLRELVSEYFPPNWDDSAQRETQILAVVRAYLEETDPALPTHKRRLAAQRQVAESFGVEVNTVQSKCGRETWAAHVEEDAQYQRDFFDPALEQIEQAWASTATSATGPEITYFSLTVGSDEYNDYPQLYYHFKEGIPGSKQLLTARNRAKAVYLEENEFSAIVDIGPLTATQIDGETYYHAFITDYEAIEPVPLESITHQLSVNLPKQDSIVRLSEADFMLIISPEDGPIGLDPQIQSDIETLLANEKDQAPIFREALAHLVAGKNVVFYGPPGTGKTRTARLLAEAICDSINLVTANAEWSNYQVVGGYEPGEEGWEPRPGFLTEIAERGATALREDEHPRPKWLIIDELNRANLDEAFGDVFTLLDLDYRTAESLTYADQDVSVPLSFRILATMNTYDQAQLFSLGYAFRRRFAFVSVPSLLARQEGSTTTTGTATPPAESPALEPFHHDLVDLVEEAAIDAMTTGTAGEGVANTDVATVFPEFADVEQLRDALDALRTTEALQTDGLTVTETLVYFTTEITDRDVIDVGQALLIDVTKYLIAHQLLFPDATTQATLDDAVMAYIVPQFEHFMSELRRAETINRDSDAKARFEQIIQLANDLNLPQTAAILDEAADTKRILA